MTTETRTEVIFRYTQRQLRETRCSWEAFSQELVEQYHRRVPVVAREIQFKTDGDIFICARANAQKVARYADDRINARLPVDLEEAWVFALAQPYRDECMRELVRRYGFLPVPAPESTKPSCAVSATQLVSTLSREFGQAIESLAPIIANGSIGPEDYEHIALAKRELEELIAGATAALHELRRIEEMGQ